MTYVPIVIPQEQPSPRTRELADLLSRVIVDFEEKHPSVTGHEVREATRLAAQASRGAGQPALMIALVLGGLLTLGVGAFLFLSQATEGGAPQVDPPIVIVGVLIAIVALLAILMRRAP